MSILTPQQIADIKAEILILQAKLASMINANKSISSTGQRIYNEAALSLGKHMTLDDTVPAEVGCAEAVSAVLSLAGISDGAKGISGTASLYEWLNLNPLFEKIDTPEEGAIVISPTGMGNGSIPGHVGIVGIFGKMYPGDWGICSNESASGLFKEQWNWTKWNAYYGKVGGLPIYLFKAK